MAARIPAIDRLGSRVREIYETPMDESDKGYDYKRYRDLLAEATDESKRLAFIDLLIKEGARDQLTRERIRRLGLTRLTDRPHNRD